MLPWYERHMHLLRRLIGFVIFIYLFTVVIAWIWGFSLDPTSLPQTMNPIQTTQNLPTLIPLEVRNTIMAIGQGIQPYQGWIFIMGTQIFMFVGIFWFMASGTTHTIFPGQHSTSFKDVRGQNEIVASVRQVMDLFHGHKEFKQHFGGYPPRGILFEGPPGTGKTLLAKAVAGETGVPFMYASGAGFANMFLGVPQLKVRSMFNKARKYARRWGGCVIFLDELDSIGGRRSGVSHAFSPIDGVNRFVVPGFGGGDSMLVKALLTELDGMDKHPFLTGLVRRLFRIKPTPVSHNILIIGATNRSETLDPALLRHGRFDRKIHVGFPSEEGRKDIIAYYLAKISHVPIDIDRLAKATAGYSPAKIKAIINEGLIFAHRNGRDAVSYEDIWQAKLHDEIGLVDPVQYSDNEKRIIAVHEAAHAVAMQFLDDNHEVQIVSARKRSGTLGVVHSQEIEERFGKQKDELLASIKISLAGMVAEEIWLGQSSSGPSSDLRNATFNAVRMIAHFGMGSYLVSHTLLEGSQSIDDSISLAVRDPEIRKEVDAILQQCKIDVRRLLEEHRQAVEVTRDALLQRDELTGDEFRQLLYSHGLLSELPAQALPMPIARPHIYDPDAQSA